MAKRKTVETTPDTFLGTLRSTLASVNGDASITEYSSHRSFIGIPIPSIAFQWVLSSNTLPLSRMIELAGPPETCKSTFLYEVMRWFLGAGGHVVLFETEIKDNPELRHGVLRHDPDAISRVTVVPVTQYEKWVEGATAAMTSYQRYMADTGNDFPVLVCVDSLVAAPTERQLKEVKEEGHTGLGYSGHAKALSQDLKTFSKFLSHSPFTFCFTNHMKQEMTGYGLPKDTRSGGRGPEFHETVSLKFKPEKSTRIVRANYTGRRLCVTTEKNSIGPKRSMSIVLYYMHEQNPLYDPSNPLSSPYRLIVEYDWGEVDMEFLLGLMSGKIEGISSEKRKIIANMLQISCEGDRLYSPVLNVTKDAPVTLSEMGRLILSNHEIVRALQDELYIKRHPIYKAGIDYNKMVEAYTKDCERQYTVPVSQEVNNEGE